MTMGVERYTSVANIAAEWDDLALRTGARPFARPGWIGAWWNAFGAGALDVLAVRRQGELAGVLPVSRRWGGVHAPTNWHTPVFDAVVADDEARRELYEAALSRAQVYAQLRFLGDDAEVAAAAARERRFSVETRVLQSSPYVPLEGEVAKPREKVFRRTREKLAADGGLTLDLHDGAAGIDSTLPEFLELEGSGWKLEQGTAVVSRPDTLRFYTDVMRWAAAEGILRLFFLRVGGRAIATECCLVQDGSTYNVKGGYDPAHRKISPGMLIADSIINWSKEQGFHTYEFLGAAEPWKLEWTDLTRDRVAVEAFSRRAGGAAVRRAYVRGRPLARRGLTALKQAVRRS